MTARQIAVRVGAGILLFVVIAAATIILAISKSDSAGDTAKSAGDTAKTNAGAIAKLKPRVRGNTARLTANERKDAATRWCQTAAKDVQACIERVIGAQGPGGEAGRAGAPGKRGLAGLAGKRGKPGRPGRDAPRPTAERIAKGFEVWCRRVICVGADGRDGRDAPPITMTELLDALTTVCGGSCRGEDGAPATQSQVTAAVAAFCASGGCSGPVGPVGPVGPAGAQGEPGQPAAQVPCAQQPPEAGYACVEPGA